MQQFNYNDFQLHEQIFAQILGVEDDEKYYYKLTEYASKELLYTLPYGWEVNIGEDDYAGIPYYVESTSQKMEWIHPFEEAFKKKIEERRIDLMNTTNKDHNNNINNEGLNSQVSSLGVTPRLQSTTDSSTLEVSMYALSEELFSHEILFAAALGVNPEEKHAETLYYLAKKLLYIVPSGWEIFLLLQSKSSSSEEEANNSDGFSSPMIIPYYYESTVNQSHWIHPYKTHYRDLIQKKRLELQDTAVPDVTTTTSINNKNSNNNIGGSVLPADPDIMNHPHLQSNNITSEAIPPVHLQRNNSIRSVVSMDTDTEVVEFIYAGLLGIVFDEQYAEQLSMYAKVLLKTLPEHWSMSIIVESNHNNSSAEDEEGGGNSEGVYPLFVNSKEKIEQIEHPLLLNHIDSIKNMRNALIAGKTFHIREQQHHPSQHTSAVLKIEELQSSKTQPHTTDNTVDVTTIIGLEEKFRLEKEKLSRDTAELELRIEKQKQEENTIREKLQLEKQTYLNEIVLEEERIRFERLRVEENVITERFKAEKQTIKAETLQESIRMEKQKREEEELIKSFRIENQHIDQAAIEERLRIEKQHQQEIELMKKSQQESERIRSEKLKQQEETEIAELLKLESIRKQEVEEAERQRFEAEKRAAAELEELQRLEKIRKDEAKALEIIQYQTLKQQEAEIIELLRVEKIRKEQAEEAERLRLEKIKSAAAELEALLKQEELCKKVEQQSQNSIDDSIDDEGLTTSSLIIDKNAPPVEISDSHTVLLAPALGETQWASSLLSAFDISITDDNTYLDGLEDNINDSSAMLLVDIEHFKWNKEVNVQNRDTVNISNVDITSESSMIATSPTLQPAFELDGDNTIQHISNIPIQQQPSSVEEDPVKHFLNEDQSEDANKIQESINNNANIIIEALETVKTDNNIVVLHSSIDNTVKQQHPILSASDVIHVIHILKIQTRKLKNVEYGWDGNDVYVNLSYIPGVGDEQSATRWSHQTVVRNGAGANAEWIYKENTSDALFFNMLTEDLLQSNNNKNPVCSQNCLDILVMDKNTLRADVLIGSAKVSLANSGVISIKKDINYNNPIIECGKTFDEIILVIKDLKNKKSGEVVLTLVRETILNTPPPPLTSITTTSNISSNALTQSGSESLVNLQEQKPFRKYSTRFQSLLSNFPGTTDDNYLSIMDDNTNNDYDNTNDTVNTMDKDIEHIHRVASRKQQEIYQEMSYRKQQEVDEDRKIMMLNYRIEQQQQQQVIDQTLIFPSSFDDYDDDNNRYNKIGIGDHMHSITKELEINSSFKITLMSPVSSSTPSVNEPNAYLALSNNESTTTIAAAVVASPSHTSINDHQYMKSSPELSFILSVAQGNAIKMKTQYLDILRNSKPKDNNRNNNTNNSNNNSPIKTTDHHYNILVTSPPTTNKAPVLEVSESSMRYVKQLDLLSKSSKEPMNQQLLDIKEQFDSIFKAPSRDDTSCCIKKKKRNISGKLSAEKLLNRKGWHKQQLHHQLAPLMIPPPPPQMSKWYTLGCYESYKVAVKNRHLILRIVTDDDPRILFDSRIEIDDFAASSFVATATTVVGTHKSVPLPVGAPPSSSSMLSNNHQHSSQHHMMMIKQAGANSSSITTKEEEAATETVVVPNNRAVSPVSSEAMIRAYNSPTTKTIVKSHDKNTSSLLINYNNNSNNNNILLPKPTQHQQVPSADDTPSLIIGRVCRVSEKLVKLCVRRDVCRMQWVVETDSLTVKAIANRHRRQKGTPSEKSDMITRKLLEKFKKNKQFSKSLNNISAKIDDILNIKENINVLELINHSKEFSSFANTSIELNKRKKARIHKGNNRMDLLPPIQQTHY